MGNAFAGKKKVLDGILQTKKKNYADPNPEAERYVHFLKGGKHPSPPRGKVHGVPRKTGQSPWHWGGVKRGSGEGTEKEIRI